MAVIVVTRLRLRDPALLDEFFTHATAVLEHPSTANQTRSFPSPVEPPATGP
jgi:hypothetical protein